MLRRTFILGISTFLITKSATSATSGTLPRLCEDSTDSRLVSIMEFRAALERVSIAGFFIAAEHGLLKFDQSSNTHPSRFLEEHTLEVSHRIFSKLRGDLELRGYSFCLDLLSPPALPRGAPPRSVPFQLRTPNPNTEPRPKDTE